MGSLTLPNGGLVYLDASPIIYAIEKIAPYALLLHPVWEAAQKGQIRLVGSELLLLETLVKPVQLADRNLETAFRSFLRSQEMTLFPITTAVLEEAIQLRAIARLKTPDAIHAATARLTGCDLFITNDKIFERVSQLRVAALQDHL